MSGRRESIKGFTLVEMMIVVAIVAILMAIGIPSYQSQVIKTKRGLARGELQTILSRQEQYFINNKQYTTDLTDLGYAANGYFIDNEANDTAAATSGSIYKIQFASTPTASASVYTMEAVPQGQQVKDTQCATLRISHTGVKTATGSGDCW